MDSMGVQRKNGSTARDNEETGECVGVLMPN